MYELQQFEARSLNILPLKATDDLVGLDVKLWFLLTKTA